MLVKLFKSLFIIGHPRSVKANINIAFSLGLKGVSIIIGLIFVPLILNYLDVERYGIWLTLSSIIGWFSFFDIGLGNGLRNKLAESLVVKDFKLAKTYISTTYAVLGTVFSVVLLIFFIVNKLLNWQGILNTTVVSGEELSLIAMIVFTFFIFRFFFSLIGSILLAHQETAINSSFGPIGNIISLLIIIFLIRTTEGSLLLLTSVLSVAPVVVLAIATFIFFNKRYKNICPSISYIDFKKTKSIFSLGFKFFILQIAYIFFFTTANILIAQFSSQIDVVNYNITYKYYSVLIMISTVILNPSWSSTTDAYYNNDLDWIKNNLKRLLYIELILVISLIIMFLWSNKIFSVWLGDIAVIPTGLNIVSAIFVLIQLVIYPFSFIINGIGKLRVSLFSILIRVVVYFPLAIYYGKIYGAIGIVGVMASMQFIPLVLYPYQVNLLLTQRAKGIWNR
jgi:O-antigen/teichoic acid export membrane protein